MKSPQIMAVDEGDNLENDPFGRNFFPLLLTLAVEGLLLQATMDSDSINNMLRSSGDTKGPTKASDGFGKKDVITVQLGPNNQIAHQGSFTQGMSYMHSLDVVLIGNSASAVDVSRNIAKVAKEVHISSRSAPDGPTTILHSAFFPTRVVFAKYSIHAKELLRL